MGVVEWVVMGDGGWGADWWVGIGGVETVGVWWHG